jgi:hypothetical protein
MSKYLARLNALLVQAEGAGTPEEAAAYMAKAQDLVTVHGLSLEVVRQAGPKTHAATPTMRQVVLTQNRTQKYRKKLVELFHTIAQQNEVRITIYGGDRVVDAYGFEEDIDAVETLYGSLATQMVEAANKSIARKEHQGHFYRVSDWNSDHYGDYRPVTGQMWRGSFYDGFIARISARLRDARKEAERRAEQTRAEDEARFAELLSDAAEEYVPAENAPVSREVGLVLADKKEKVQAHYKAATKHIRGSWKGSASKTSAGRSAGREAGDRARIGAQDAIGGKRAAIGA